MQARLLRLLIEATDRLERERGLPRTAAAKLARLHSQTDGGSDSDETSDDKPHEGTALNASEP